MKLTTLAVAIALTGINCLSYFVFPGHTYLTSDTQIYLPMLERLWDPQLLGKDLIATNPHLSFSIYDELALTGRKVTGLGFNQVLPTLHFVFRLAGIYGIWLIFRAWSFSRVVSLFGVGCYALGAFVHGPAVMLWELEPVPRAMALPLLWLAIGWIANEFPKRAAIAAGVALLVHPPTVWAVWLVMGFLLLRPPATGAWPQNRLQVAGILGGFVVLLVIVSRFQVGEQEKQNLFVFLDQSLEHLQRMRASYNWVGMWLDLWWGKYLLLLAASLLSAKLLWVLAPETLRHFHVGLTIIGVFSIPLSYLILEQGKWAMGPQLQVGRALLFVMAWAVLGAIAVGIRYAQRKRYWLSLVWFYLAYSVPVQTQTWEAFLPFLTKEAVLKKVVLLLLLSMLAVTANVLMNRKAVLGPALICLAILFPFWAIPNVAGISTHPKVYNPDLESLIAWSKQTPTDSVFHFPDAGKELYPGVFRGESARAIFVDWKSGGQVNFHKRLADEWWARWQATLAKPYLTSLEAYKSVPADYLVLKAKDRFKETNPIFENSTFVVYSTH